MAGVRGHGQLGQLSQLGQHGTGRSTGDYFTSEFEINSAPLTARNLLTKGFIQDEINQCSGAAISTRGRYIAKNDHPKGQNDRPLYLFIQGPTEQSIELAVQKINDIIRSDLHNAPRPPMNNNNNQGPPNRQMMPPNINNKPPAINNSTHIDKVFVGLDGVPVSFDLRGKIIGQGGSNLQYIRTETGAAITLRGRGSQFVDHQTGRESSEPLHLYIEHPRQDGLAAARSLVVNLIDTLIQELQQTTDYQVPNTQQNLTNNQIFDYPPRMVSAPPITIPPPTQQQFTIAGPMQHQQQNSVEQQMLIGSNNTIPTQIHVAPNQVQNVNQITQGQQIVLQQPPPMIRPPTVSISPPGIHIPQHTATMVPPPQIVQLSAPPPNVTGSGNVLVVGPNTNQSLYIPEMAASSSSMATFSFVQGGVLYHQAPPVQTQAQIGDGLHIITTPSQQMSEMSPLVHPQTQMIITQVQPESGNQIPGDQQFSQAGQQPKHQYHVIGHVQTAQISQEDNSLQHPQHIIQSQDPEGFPQFNQPPVSTGQMVYHMNLPAGNPHITTIAVSQNELQQLNAMQNQHDGIIKQSPNQILNQLPHNQNQIVERTQVQIAQIPNMQQEPIMQTQLNNGPNIFTQMPPNQILMEQMPNTNLIATPVNNQIVQHQQQPNQFIIQQQQPQQQFPHQFLLQQQNPVTNPSQQPPQVISNVNYQNQFAQQQQQFEPQNNQQNEMRRNENQPRNRHNNRNRRNQRNNRQNPYPWNKNDEKSKYNSFGDNQSWKNNKKNEDQNNRYQNDGESHQDDRNFKHNMNPANQQNFQSMNNMQGSWGIKAENIQKNMMDNLSSIGFSQDFQPSNATGLRSSKPDSIPTADQPIIIVNTFLRSQNAGRPSAMNKVYGQADPGKGDKRLSSPGTRWSEQSGEPLRNIEKSDNLMKDQGPKGSPNVRINNQEDKQNESVKQHGHQWNDQRPEMNQFSNQNISIPDKDPNNMPYLLPPPPPPPQSQVQMNLQRFNQPNGGNQFDNPAMYQNFQPNIMNMAPPTMVPSPGQMIPGGNQGQIMVGGNQGQMIPSMVPPPSIPPNRSQQAVMHGSSQQMSYPYWMNH